MVKYIAKHDPDGWFKPGTEVKLIDDYNKETNGKWNAGLFEGIRVCENPLSEGQWHEIGDEYIDQEVCPWEEFEIIED